MSQNHGIGLLLDIVALLRDPSGGCPWDKEQTFASTVCHTIEEAYEVADAIEKNDMTLLKEELGDLLLQIVFYAQMAKEHSFFAFADITACLTDKLVRRHPHVFGNMQVMSAEEQLVVWDALKEEEQQQSQQTSTALPALSRANKLIAFLERESIDILSISKRISKMNRQATALRAALSAAGVMKEQLVEGLGDLLFTCVRLAYQLKIDPEIALRKAHNKLERCFRHL